MVGHLGKEAICCGRLLFVAGNLMMIGAGVRCLKWLGWETTPLMSQAAGERKTQYTPKWGSINPSLVDRDRVGQGLSVRHLRPARM